MRTFGDSRRRRHTPQTGRLRCTAALASNSSAPAFSMPHDAYTPSTESAGEPRQKLTEAGAPFRLIAPRKFHTGGSAAGPVMN
jgi:hypothetical protein